MTTIRGNSLSGSVNLFKGVNVTSVRVFEGQFVPREPKLVQVIGSLEKLRVREIRGEIIEL